MNLKNLLMTQPLSLWLSLIATVISIGGFFLNLKNTKRTQKIDALQRRTQLLTKVYEAQLKAEIADIKLGKLDLLLIEIKSNTKLDPTEVANIFSAVDKDVSTIHEHVSRNKVGLDTIRSNIEKFTAETDPAAIERINPMVNRIMSQLDNLLNHIDNCMERFNHGLQMLQNVHDAAAS